MGVTSDMTFFRSSERNQLSQCSVEIHLDMTMRLFGFLASFRDSPEIQPGA